MELLITAIALFIYSVTIIISADIRGLSYGSVTADSVKCLIPVINIPWALYDKYIK